MYRLNHLHSAKHLFANFPTTTTASAASAHLKRFDRLNQPLRHVSSVAFRRRVMDYLESLHGGSNDRKNNYEGKILHPELLSRNVVKLTCESAADGGVCDVYLVGTTSRSKKSCQEVKDVINILKPQVVFLELCSSRIHALAPKNVKVRGIGKTVEMLKRNQDLLGILFSWFSAEVDRRLEVLHGGQFRMAYEEAIKYGGKVILGDRPTQITWQRTLAKIPLWHKAKLVSSLLLLIALLPIPGVMIAIAERVEELENEDLHMRTVRAQELSDQFPTLMETIWHERYLYMSATLLKVAREHNSVVAVVGKAHVLGIKNNWKQSVDVKQLLSMPSKKNTITGGKILVTIGLTIAGVAIISGLDLSVNK